MSCCASLLFVCAGSQAEIAQPDVQPALSDMAVPFQAQSDMGDGQSDMCGAQSDVQSEGGSACESECPDWDPHWSDVHQSEWAIPATDGEAALVVLKTRALVHGHMGAGVVKGGDKEGKNTISNTGESCIGCAASRWCRPHDSCLGLVCLYVCSCVCVRPLVLAGPDALAPRSQRTSVDLMAVRASVVAQHTEHRRRRATVCGTHAMGGLASKDEETEVRPGRTCSTHMDSFLVACTAGKPGASPLVHMRTVAKRIACLYVCFCVGFHRPSQAFIQRALCLQFNPRPHPHPHIHHRPGHCCAARPDSCPLTHACP